MDSNIILNLLNSWDGLNSIEVTPKNFILAHSITGDDLWVLHYTANEKIMCSLLIDHIWSEKYFPKYQVRHDIYICNFDVVPKSFVIEDTDYLYFSIYTRVSKTFVCITDFPSNYFNSLQSSWRIKSLKPEPLISIITTVYNNAKKLELTIQSVINQFADDFEYVVKDAGSNDNIDEIIHNYDYGIDVYLSNRDNGIYDGMHQGILNSKGTYFMILNSDDIFANFDVVKSYYQEAISSIYDSLGASIEIYYPNRPKKIVYPNPMKLYKETSIPHTSFLLKRDIYLSLGGFKTWMKVTADRALEIEVLKNGYTYKSLNKIVVYFNGTGTSANMTWSRLFEQLYCCYKYSPYNIKGYIHTLKYFYLCFK